MDSLKIGNITLPHRAVFGPMAGFTDAPCRRLMAQHGAGFTVSEMVSSRALVYHDHKTVSLLKAEPNGAPYGVQIFGEVPQIMGEAAAAIEEYQFDFLDINMGCPARKVVSSGEGSALLLDPERAARIMEAVRRNTSLPVTVKTRLGYDADSVAASLENIVYLELCRRGYTVNVGKTDGGEIDFVAERQNERLYVQVTQEIRSERTAKREYERLLEIRDNYPKYVLTTDAFAGGNYQGIRTMHIADFLLSTEY